MAGYLRKGCPCLFYLLLSLLPALASASNLISFEMEDQFKEKHTDLEFRDRILIVIGSDREGSKFNEVWISALVDSFTSEFQNGKLLFLGVADLRGVPFFLKSFVRGAFPKKKSEPILMDWKGKFSEVYGFKKKLCNLAVFNQKNELVYQGAQAGLDSVEIQNLTNTLRNLLPSAPVSQKTFPE